MKEKEKNSAVEKVEAITTSKSPEKETKTQEKAESKAKQTVAEQMKQEVTKSDKQGNKTVKTKKTQKKVNVPKGEKDKAKKKREAEKEELRLKRAQQKQEKKELNRAKHAERKQAMKERMERFKLEALKRKEERKKRRDMLKSESKADRIERKAKEQQAKRDERLAKRDEMKLKREERAKLKRERLQARKALKEQRRQLRMENRKDKRSRGIGGWLAAVISLGCSVLVLGTLFTISLVNNFGGDNMFENSVERAFYDFVSYVDNMEVNMSKLMVSGDSNEQQRLLSDLTVQANLASSDIAEIPLQDESRFYTAKFVNQVGDYSKYLNNKLIDGDKLSETDWKNISSLYQISLTLKSELSELTNKLGENYEFVSLLSDGSENVVLDSFVTLEEGAVDYPKLIYDGPFSDSLETVKAKGIKGEEINATEAVEIFKSIFKDYSFDKAEVVGEVNGKISCYSVEGMVGDNSIYAEISKVGGNLILANSFMNCTASEYDLTSCIQVADAFVADLGIKNMKAVWTTSSDATVYLNYAYTQNDVVVYPDMIKLTVCQERGVVSGFDATEYYLNHTSRKVGKAKLTKAQAIKKLSSNLEVESVRLAVIPKGNETEALTYEVCGKFNGATYYVYIDATTGKESQIFRVVETTEGTLLI